MSDQGDVILCSSFHSSSFITPSIFFFTFFYPPPTTTEKKRLYNVPETAGGGGGNGSGGGGSLLEMLQQRLQKYKDAAAEAVKEGNGGKARRMKRIVKVGVGWWDGSGEMSWYDERLHFGNLRKVPIKRPINLLHHHHGSNMKRR